MDKNNLNNRDIAFYNNKEMTFSVSARIDSRLVVWNGVYNINKRRCVTEHFFFENKEILAVNRGFIYFMGKKEKNILLYEGSFLKMLKRSLLIEAGLQSFLEFMEKIHICYSSNINELVSTYNQRDGRGGGSLTRDFSLLSPVRRKEFLCFLLKFYPQIIDLRIVKHKACFDLFAILRDEYNNERLIHLCNVREGCVKVMKFLLEYVRSESIVAFDNIEFWIPDSLLDKAIHFITSEKKQIIVTTHIKRLSKRRIRAAS